MDDAQTYLLNGLLGRQFGLGRIVRFRLVKRGLQATTFELLTVQQNEYLVSLFPATFAVDKLGGVAEAVNALDEHRFSVVPFLKTKAGGFTAEGPQHTTLMVSLAPVGSVLEPEQYTVHDISQVGLRLAWMHRLMGEHLPLPDPQMSLAERLQPLASEAAPLEGLFEVLKMPAAQGWTHGHISAEALLHDSDHQLRTVTDFGLLHVGSPLEDVVDALLALCVSRDLKGTRMNAERGKALLEAYHSLVPIKRVPWTPVVASWCAQRLLDAPRRALPGNFGEILSHPENLATALASCL